MWSVVRFGGVVLIVLAFFFAVGAVVSLGNGLVLVGLLMLLLATLLAFAGWAFRGYQRARR